ncbi:ribosomal eS8-like protein [Fragilaria crotonensis]|nr:ribosomal eS8-like protein [Fragilaria crotonensis]
MGITREGRHKRRETGGRRAQFRKKRKFELGRPPAMTKIGEPRIHEVRVLDVAYNASNNELVRTKTLVKGAIVVIDGNPFKSYYESHYGIKLGLKKASTESALVDLSSKCQLSQDKIKARQSKRVLDPLVDAQFASGRLLAKITSDLDKPDDVTDMSWKDVSFSSTRE